MARPVGRPMKYRHYLTILDDDTLYSPASIVDWGVAHGLMEPNLSEDERKDIRRKIRHTLARFSKNHQFPDDGEGLVGMYGQAPIRAWTGRTWKGGLPRL